MLVHGHFVYFVVIFVYLIVIWYISPRSGMLNQQKSGNPAASTKILVGKKLVAIMACPARHFSLKSIRPSLAHSRPALFRTKCPFLLPAFVSRVCVHLSICASVRPAAA
jgi:hypothetical protein